MSKLNYNNHIIEQVNVVTEKCGSILLFGENIDTGSRIGGLARGLKVNKSGRIQNVGNCELMHCGVGLGMMLDGGQAALFVKQLDFMLLGIDQMCNTFNFIRAYRSRNTWGSFTIFTIVCDQGYQGPQSSLNGASDFASLANIPVYCLNGTDDASQVVQNHFASPGFRMMCLSQRLFGAPILDIAAEWSANDNSIFRYKSGSDITIVSLNFSLRDALSVDTQLNAAGVRNDVFHVNFLPGMNMEPLVESCAKTGKLIVVDDSKSVTKFSDVLVADLCMRGVTIKLLSFNRRGCSDNGYGANDDQFVPDLDKALAFSREK